MKNFKGEIEVFLNCVGSLEGDSRILDAMVLPGSNFTIESLRIEGIVYDTYKFLENGIEFSFEDKVLKAIFIYATKVKDYSPYFFINNLFQNIINIYDKKSIMKSIGEPDEIKDNYIKYYINKDKYIHFEFGEFESLKMITVGLAS
ncbi:hypothetical protein [Psychrobacter lutiphocae]|uniref:hypothetical protein n=1 Tax=Psychrobacter lutiphocae TaxID=540500 RepID=UPI0003814456|nr:hypothetical protein [Psychrobacter lutiphocae]